MVGSDPSLGQSTTVDTTIVPLRFEFVAGALDGADNVADTIASPVFTPTSFPISRDSGVQFGDAFARAQFGKVGTGYHVILGQPRVSETVTIQVPESQGVAVLSPLGVMVGRVDSTWFKTRLAAIIDEMNLKPTILPIFLTNNVGLYSDASHLRCCILGGHGAGSPASDAPISLAGKDKIRTFVFAAYLTPNGFSRNPAISDIHALSHDDRRVDRQPVRHQRGSALPDPERHPGHPRHARLLSRRAIRWSAWRSRFRGTQPQRPAYGGTRRTSCS